jgi:hypothetical protein
LCHALAKLQVVREFGWAREQGEALSGRRVIGRQERYLGTFLLLPLGQLLVVAALLTPSEG